MANPGSFSRLLYLVIFILLTTSCAQLRPDTNPFLDQKALVRSRQAKLFNQHIAAGKGIGWARLETKNRVEKFKIAWAAVFPDKIRITFLLSGLPIETIAATGEKITFLSHTGKHARYSHHSKDMDMSGYLNIPIKLSEMISILLGRLPIIKFDDAYFAPSDPSLATIALRQNWKGNTQYLHLTTKGKIDGIKIMNMNKKILYDMAIMEYKSYGSFDIPVRISIKDPNNRLLNINITNFLPNPPIKDSVFQLTESR